MASNFCCQIKQTDFMLLISNRSKMTSKCDKNKNVACKPIDKCVTDVLTTFWHLLWSFAEQKHIDIDSACFIKYSCFEKGCLKNGEKLTRQCRKLLWVMVDFTVTVNLEVFQHDGRKHHKHVYSFFLAPCCWIALNLNQARPNIYYP